MAILRNPNRGKFTVVGNYALRDDNLSLKARGLLVTMLSLPDSWQFSENGLCSIFKKDGQSSIRSGLKELEEAGYLVRTRTRDSLGRVSSVDWTIYDYPHVENHNVVKPNLDLQPQLNTNQSKTKESNTDNKSPHNPPKGERAATHRRAKAPDYDADGFAAFWAAYPKKAGKADALKAWNKLAPDVVLQEQMGKALEVQKQSQQWRKDGGQYIPMPATWLNGRRWEDEAPQTQGEQQKKATEEVNARIFEDLFGGEPT